MTTIAWRPGMLATDTLSVDTVGLKAPCKKLFRANGFILGGAGSLHQVVEYYRHVKDMEIAQILELGYPNYDENKNCPSMILCNPHAPHMAFELCGTQWLQILMPFYAVGSGRDFALAAMHLGKSAEEAVRVAMQFDLKTGMDIDVAVMGDAW